MKVLVIGGGGREHALAWKLAQSARVQTVFVAPGNAGTAAEPQLKNVAITDLEQAGRLRARPRRSPSRSSGPRRRWRPASVDIFRAAGLRIFGPTRAAAQLESSKAFAKAFMQRHAIPTAGYAVFEDAAAAHAHVDARGAPIVVKADGLAAGKGVVVATTRDEAHAAIDAMLGAAATARRAARRRQARVVDRGVPRRARRPASSCVCDGRSVLSLATSQDHKRLARRRHRPEHRRHGRLLAGAGRHARTCTRA